MNNGLTSRCSSVVEHFLGKEEVDSSILFNGSRRIEIEEYLNVLANGPDSFFEMIDEVKSA